MSGLTLSKTAKSKNKRKQCVFTTARLITRKQISATVIRNLQIRDDRAGDGPFRNIILVGQSIKQDLKVLRCLGLELFHIAPVLTTIDTYLLARYTLPPYNPDIRLLPEQTFTLRGVLSKLGFEPDTSEFHNAGNDAVFALYAMLRLAVNHTTDRAAELDHGQMGRLEVLRSLPFPAKIEPVSVPLY